MGPPRADRLLARAALAAVAGLVLSLAFEPVALPWVLPLGVAGFALATRGTSARRAWLPGLAFGVAFYFTHIWWMRAVGTGAWIALAGVEALFYGVAGSLSALVQRRRGGPLWFAAAWTAVEVWRSGWPFSGMPWGRLAFGVIDTPLARSLPYVGAVGVSFLVALLGALLAQAIADRDARRPTVVGLVAVVAVLALPVVHPWHATETRRIPVAAVQGNVPGTGDDILRDYRQVTRNHVDATIGLAEDVANDRAVRPAFVVWPENSTAIDPFSDPETNVEIDAAVKAIDVPILVGAIVNGGPAHVLNQGIVWDPVTGAGDRYTKWHPVPYGEYIPYRRFLGSHTFGRLSLIPRDMLSGSRREPLHIDGIPVADAICFDVAYDDGISAQLANGAQLLVVQTSNATFIHTDQIDQQFAITRLRAIESGRWVVVASTNGRTGVIAPDGRVVATLAPRTQGVVSAEVGLVEAVTPATRLGPWPARLSIAVTLLAAGLSLLVDRRQYRRSQPDPRQPEQRKDVWAPTSSAVS